LIQIVHFLASKEKDMEDVEVVFSHPQPIGQCRNFLAELDVNLRITSSSAEAGKLAARTPGSAAIVSREAVNIYGLQVLAEGIQDYPSNVTRFIVYGKSRSHRTPTGHDFTLILVMFAEDRPGMLYETLGEIAKRDINLTTLIARPTKRSLGAYHFFLSMEGHIDEPRVKEAVEKIAEKNKVRFLGSYPQAQL
jgi:prephenate dehydratase